MPGRLFSVDIGASASSADRVSPASWTSTWSQLPERASHRIAPVTSAAQAYYWTRVWQEGERETLAALARGEGRTFADADAAIRYLLSADA